ncbi:MAG: LysE family translocator [Candidatus Symbiobacter sp.]|nr:LysE family translocator [Candidatus Symbiobacter sp.]
MTLDKYFWLAVYVCGFCLLPGPGVAAMLATSLRLGFWRGLIFSVGEASGDIFYAALAMFALGTAAAYVEPAVIWVRYVGGAYLVWMGWQQFYAASPPAEAADTHPRTAATTPATTPVKTLAPPAESALKLFVSGAVISLANPKLILFYGTIFPLFVPLATINWQQSILVLLVVQIAALVGVIVITAFGGSLQALNQNPVSRRWMARISGGVIMAVGVFIALEEFIFTLWSDFMSLF